MTPEGKVKQWCRKKGGAFDQFFPGHTRISPRGGPFASNGVSDDILCWFGVFIAIEVKATALDQPTALQVAFLKDIIQSGGVGAVLKGKDVEKLQRIRQAAIDVIRSQHLRLASISGS